MQVSKKKLPYKADTQKKHPAVIGVYWYVVLLKTCRGFVI